MHQDGVTGRKGTFAAGNIEGGTWGFEGLGGKIDEKAGWDGVPTEASQVGIDTRCGCGLFLRSKRELLHGEMSQYPCQNPLALRVLDLTNQLIS